MRVRINEVLAVTALWNDAWDLGPEQRIGCRANGSGADASISN